MADDTPPEEDELGLTYAEFLTLQLSDLRHDIDMLRNGVAALLLLVNGEKIKLNLSAALGVHPDHMEGIVRIFPSEDDPEAPRH